MKTPISYYGGKQNLLSEILPMIPEHHVYVEPFCGGASVFFAKQESPVEVINDINSEACNFFKILKTEYPVLKKLVEGSLFSRESYRHAMVIYNNPELFSPVQRAWAFFIATQQGFSNKIGSWAVERTVIRQTKGFKSKKERFCELYAERLQHAQIENLEAVELIKKRDDENVFFYCDPPYLYTSCGHYKGYTEANYRELLDTLSRIKGKFLLSSFPNDILAEYIKANNWQVKEIMQTTAVNGKRKAPKSKTELLVWNY